MKIMLSTAQNVHSTFTSPEKISILLVSEYQEDHSSLRQILHHEGWQITRCGTVQEAATHVKTVEPSVVICEHDLPDGSWKDVLNHTDGLDHPPPVLVVSRHADEHLWGEVLNLGGYDVLIKPFDRSEVTRVVGMAWRHWFRPTSAKLATQYA
jgi:DNA-binding response OmpR family regulator